MITWYKKQRNCIITYLQSDFIEKYQLELCSKYDRENDFDVILGKIIPCRKLKWICRKHSNDVARQVETPGKSTTFVVRHNFHVALEITLYDDCKTSRCSNRCTVF